MMNIRARPLLAFTLGIASIPLAVLLLAWLGQFEVSATDEPPAWEQALAERALDTALARDAKGLTPPRNDDEQSLLAGMKLYRNNCAGCHGDFNAPSSWGSRNFYPRVPQFPEHPPDLSLPEMYVAIKYGIRYSGMGAWNGMLSEEEIWRVALFLSRLEALPPDVDAVWRKTPAGA